MMGKLYVDRVLEIASAELGYREKATNAQLDDKYANAGNGNYTKYARDLYACIPSYYQGPKQGYQWCAVFVDWCILMACGGDAEKAQQAMCYTGPYGAGCSMSVMYFRDAGRFFDTPKPGDQIFFGNSSSVKHTGLVEAVNTNTVITIEGNANNQVMRKSYAITDPNIYGYGRPKYDGDTTPLPEPEPGPEPEEPCPFTDVLEGKWYTGNVLWGWKKGITSGRTADTFAPDANITRAEALTMIRAAVRLIAPDKAE